MLVPPAPVRREGARPGTSFEGRSWLIFVSSCGCTSSPGFGGPAMANAGITADWFSPAPAGVGWSVDGFDGIDVDATPQVSGAVAEVGAAGEVEAVVSGRGWLRVQAGPLRKRPGQLPELPRLLPNVTGVFHTKSLVVFPRVHQSWLEAETFRQIQTDYGTGQELSWSRHSARTTPSRSGRRQTLPGAMTNRPSTRRYPSSRRPTRRVDAAYVRAMGVPNLILQCRAELKLVHERHLGGFQRLRGIPAVERT